MSMCVRETWELIFLFPSLATTDRNSFQSEVTGSHSFYSAELVRSLPTRLSKSGSLLWNGSPDTVKETNNSLPSTL